MKPNDHLVSCRWEADDDGIYQTACGHAFIFTDDGPRENKMQFCCYCGFGLDADPVGNRSTMRAVADSHLGATCE